MMKLKINRLTLSLLILVIWMMITVFGEAFQAGKNISLTDLVSQQIVFALLIASLFLLISIYFFKWKDIGINLAFTGRSLLLLWLPALYIVVMITISITKGLADTQTVLFILVNSLLVGISEELMFRGILFKAAVLRLTIWQAIWFTSIIFGAIHAFNAFITGDIVAATTQALMATMSGIWLMAIRIRIGSLIPVILIHGLWDFSIFILNTGTTAAETENTTPYFHLFAPALFLLPLFLYGLFLLRHINKNHC